MSTSIVPHVRRHTGPEGPVLVTHPYQPRRFGRPAAPPYARFVDVLSKEARGGDVILIGLEHAALMLYSPKIWSGPAPSYQRRPILRRLMAEVDRETAGQPFRLDTPAGPLFLDRLLWEFAGCSGIEFDLRGAAEDRPFKARPDWSGARRSAVSR